MLLKLSFEREINLIHGYNLGIFPPNWGTFLFSFLLRFLEKDRGGLLHPLPPFASCVPVKIFVENFSSSLKETASPYFYWIAVHIICENVAVWHYFF